MKARVLVNGICVGMYNHPSRTVARHMACALSVLFAKKYPDVCQKLVDLKAGKEEEEEGEGGNESDEENKSDYESGSEESDDDESDESDDEMDF